MTQRPPLPALVPLVSVAPLPLPSSLFFLCLLIQLWMFNVNAEIRCYCNLPVCVSTGYMCKSTLGVCFSELFSASDLSRSRHGCLELHRPGREVCQPRMRSTKVPLAKFPLLVCCQEDMCNYIDNLDIKIRVDTKANHTFIPGAAADEGAYHHGGSEASLRQDLWFKAAVIAVPIAGAFILILLILLAVRMLRKDSKRQRQMMELRRHKNFTAQLLLSDPSYPEADIDKNVFEKNQTNAKLNQKSNNIYKSVNVALSCHKDMTSFCYDKPLNNNFCTSIVSWGKLNCKSSTPV